MKIEIVNTEYGDIKLPIAEKYSDCFELIVSDKYRISEKRLSWGGVIKTLIQFDLLSWFRICQIHDRWSPIKNRIYRIISSKKCISLPISTKIGYGFYIGHAICIVINGKTIIGNNVNVGQFLNIGSNKDTPAVICDNVYIAPMTCLVENVVIGFNSIIGAGAVVTKNIPPYKTYAGVPAKEISSNYTKGWHCYQIKSNN